MVGPQVSHVVDGAFGGVFAGVRGLPCWWNWAWVERSETRYYDLSNRKQLRKIEDRNEAFIAMSSS